MERHISALSVPWGAGRDRFPTNFENGVSEESHMTG